MIKKLEVLANIAVIVTSIIVCTVLVRRYVLPPSKGATVAVSAAPASDSRGLSSTRSIERGTKIVLPAIDWTKSDRTLLLALSTTCHFCSESAPFYQKLRQEKQDNVRLVALFPQAVQESRAYLDKLGVQVDDITQAPLSAVGASGTPTLLLLDNQGAVTESWVGKLSDKAAEEVRSHVSK